MRKNLLKVLTTVVLFFIPGFLLSQAPNLGSLSSFALFTSSGNISNGTGNSTNITGNIGTNSGIVTMANGTVNGTVHIANGTTNQAVIDLNTAFSSLTSVACGTTISNSLGSLTLTPNVYCTAGAASITGTLTLDGQGNPNAVFIIKTGVGLTLNNGAKVNLINSASQCNVYWQVNGALTLVNNSIIRGTVLANGTIDQQNGSKVFGRALTKTGNITLKNIVDAVAFPPTASSISAAGTTTFCSGGSVVLLGNNGGTWSTGSTAASITVNTGGTYYVTNTTNCGSITSNSIIVTVNPLPTVAVNSGTICRGNSFVLNASGASTYSWSPGATLNATTGASVIANPTITTTYSVTGTSALGCVKISTGTVTVNSNPTISVNSATICEGSSTVLTASGAATFSWSPSMGLSATNGSAVTANPSVTTIYTVTGFESNCSGSQMSTVTVNALPTATINTDGPISFCQGGSVVLTASPGNSHAWSNNEASQSITVTATGDYFVTVTDANGCSNTSSFISVFCSSIPTITVNSATICSGSSTLLNVSGADTYTWSPSAGLDVSTGASVTAGPGSTTIYTISGASGDGCVDTTTATVTVVPNPVVSVNSTTICAGTSAILTASGANSYLWSTGATTESVSVSPGSTTNYMVTGTADNGCFNTVSANVAVIFCSGETATTFVPCGNIYTSFNTYSFCKPVSGATGYRFSFYDNSTNMMVAIKTQTSNVIYFNTITGLVYGNTYKWTVSVNKGNGFGAESYNGCTITFNPPQTTLPCGSSYSNFGTHSSCTPVFGATGYRFTFYNNSTNSIVTIKTQASNVIYFNTVPGLVYGQTYKWTVEAQYNNGTNLLYGPSSPSLCTITFNPPQATLPCGSSYSNLSTYSACTHVYGATGYRFTFYDNSTNAIVANKTQASNVIYFNTVPGLVYGQIYKWTVEAQYSNGTNLLYGSSSNSLCTITFAPPYSGSLISGDSYVSNARMITYSDPTEEQFIVNAYPNPNNGIFTIDLPEDRQVEISNILGEKITEQLLVRGQNQISLEDQPDGIYFVKIWFDNRQEVIKIIKEN